MKLIVDMNLSPRWIPMLGRSQIEAVHWSSVGSVTALDTESAPVLVSPGVPSTVTFSPV